MPVFRRLLPGLTVVLPLVALSGCAWLPQSDVGGGLRASGMLHMTADEARLETCGGQVHPVHADEALRALFVRVAPAGQNVIFVDLRGQLLGDNSIRPETIIRMGATNEGCANQIAQESQWVALGERPDWRVRIASSGLQLTTLGNEWQSVIIELLPDGRRGFSTRDGEQTELWVYPDPCFSQLNGNYYEHSARLVTAGESMVGCAYQGYLASDQPSTN
ncbi:hypothetical protein [Halopseudomonas sp.]|uniref:hypothetical protein n=1 Tax=Halopseudomonas sp. TaxID=2901191 RepID=UPI00356623A5